MPLRERLRPEFFYNSSQVRATALSGREPRLVVSFTGIGKPGKREQDEEFVGGSGQNGRNHVLFVADTLRSWYNAPGIYEEIIDVISRYRDQHGIEEVVTFGNSMGGYGAIIFADPIGAKNCLALSAQYSADPKVVPEENRWLEYRDLIETFTRPPMEEMLNETCNYHVLHGGGDVEKPHWSRFPKAPNLHHYIVGSIGHGLGRQLKQRGLVETVTRMAIAGRPYALRRKLHEAFPALRSPG